MDYQCGDIVRMSGQLYRIQQYTLFAPMLVATSPLFGDSVAHQYVSDTEFVHRVPTEYYVVVASSFGSVKLTTHNLTERLAIWEAAKFDNASIIKVATDGSETVVLPHTVLPISPPAVANIENIMSLTNAAYIISMIHHAPAVIYDYERFGRSLLPVSFTGPMRESGMNIISCEGFTEHDLCVLSLAGCIVVEANNETDL